MGERGGGFLMEGRFIKVAEVCLVGKRMGGF